MAGAVQLPYKTPWFTFAQESAAACLAMRGHPTAYNAILNQCTALSFNGRFAESGAGSQMGISRSRICNFPCLEQYTISFRFGLPYCREIIREFLLKGYYIYYRGVDDYDLPGKNGYGHRHGRRDGILCGYDDNDGTYRIAALDCDWLFRPIWLPQECFAEGLRDCLARGAYSSFTAYRMRNTRIGLNEKQILRYLREYTDADVEAGTERFLPTGRGTVEGIGAQELLAVYLGKLADGEIPLYQADRQALCTVWEHKRCMLDRLTALERRHGWGQSFSSCYRPLVDAAYRNRMLYAVCCQKRRPELLGKIRDGLRAGKAAERAILLDFLRAAEENGALIPHRGSSAAQSGNVARSR